MGSTKSEASPEPVNADLEVDFSVGLRKLADLLDEYPQLKRNYDDYRHLLPVSTAEELAGIARSLGGRWKKSATDDYFSLTRDLGDGVSVVVYAAKANVCERVVVGTRKVQRVVIPDDAPTAEVEEEVVEWRCAPSVLAAAESSAA